LFLNAAPELDNKDIRSVPMGVPGEDLWMSTKAEEIYPYSVECKNVEKLNIWAAISQAREEARKNGKTPLVAFSRNHEETYVCLPIGALLDLHSRLRGIDPVDELFDATGIED
jgi:hypothetical protein